MTSFDGASTMTASEFKQEIRTILGRKKPSKYKNKRILIDGKVFDSKREADVYFDLLRQEKAGLISKLTLKPRYELRAYPFHSCDGPIKICTMIPDFEWIDVKGKVVTADCKGMITTDWKLKANMFAANYGREIVVLK